MEEPLGFVYVFVHVTLARLLNIDTSDKKKNNYNMTIKESLRFMSNTVKTTKPFDVYILLQRHLSSVMDKLRPQLPFFI